MTGPEPSNEAPSVSTQLPLRLWDIGAPRLETFAAAANPDALAFLGTPVASWPLPGVLVWGDAGYGKSHLLLGACHAQHARGARVAYLDLATGLTPAVLENLEGHDLVCLDHLDTIRGDPVWTHALFGLFERAGPAGCRLCWASRRPPSTFDSGLPDLDSRLSRCTIFRLKGLDDAALGPALVQRAGALGFELPDASVRFLLERLPRTMPVLCAALERLDVHTLSHHRRATVPAIKDALGL